MVVILRSVMAVVRVSFPQGFVPLSLNKNLDKTLQPRTLWPDYSTIDKKNKKRCSLFVDSAPVM